MFLTRYTVHVYLSSVEDASLTLFLSQWCFYGHNTTLVPCVGCYYVLNTFLVPCVGCFCGLGLVYSNKSCTMPPITFQDLPLNIYMIIFGTGIFIFILSLIFCCYFIR